MRVRPSTAGRGAVTRYPMALSPRLEWSAENTVPLSPEQRFVRDRVLSRLRDGTYATQEVPCLCGDPRGETIAERDRYGLPVRTLLCLRCGLLRTSPRMTQASTARFYDEDYRDLYKLSAGGSDELFAHQAKRGCMFRERLGSLLDTVDTVFEVGCGAGGCLLPFAEAGKNVAGADLGSEYLAEGRRHGLQLVHGDADTLRQACGQADLVFVLHVVEHFLEIPDELDRLRALLRPGGVLVVEVPGVRSIEDAYRGDILLYLQNAHTYHFTQTTLRHTLACNGFEVHYCDDSVLAICTPHTEDTAQVPALVNEAGDTMRYLARLEREFVAARVG